MNAPAIRQDLLAAAVARLPDNGLRAQRELALARFARQGLPGTREEDWRYTSLQPAVDLSNAWLASQPRAVLPGDVPSDEMPVQPAQRAIDAQWLRFLNGIRIGDTLPDPGTISIGRQPDDDRSLIADDGLSSLNAALLYDVVHIAVPEGVTITRPVGLLLANDASENASVGMTRIVFEVGPGASLDVVENHLSLSAEDSFAGVIIELRLARGAQVRYLRLQECGEAQVLTGRLQVRIGQDASLRYTSIDLGGALVRNDVAIDLVAAGSDIIANGLYLASGSQHIDNHLRIDHRVGPARSRAAFRGILHGRSRCVFNSKAIVYKGADGTDAGQSNHNLLLSDQAEIDTKPELEIHADDVKCAHGATVGQLDEAALFYLRSRGIDADAASRMLTRAFAASVLGDLSVAAAADYVAGRIDEHLDLLVSEPS
ncbi:MAG: Fe-S cluster assembly protein SufD [Woeseiaceae bacterium]|nr:Fe-S cluster assembly protein SufD [Woeseiaceae bacterium]